MILTFLAVPIRSVLLYHASAKFNFPLMVFILHFITRETIHNRHYRIFRRALWTFRFILSFHLFEPEVFHLVTISIHNSLLSLTHRTDNPLLEVIMPPSIHVLWLRSIMYTSLLLSSIVDVQKHAKSPALL